MTTTFDTPKGHHRRMTTDGRQGCILNAARRAGVSL